MVARTMGYKSQQTWRATLNLLRCPSYEQAIHRFPGVPKLGKACAWSPEVTTPGFSDRAFRIQSRQEFLFRRHLDERTKGASR